MRFLTLIEVLELHRRVIEQSGGAFGIRDVGLLESAIAQPRMTFGGEYLYSSLLEKAAALGFSIIMNHPFVEWLQLYQLDAFLAQAGDRYSVRAIEDSVL
jgi:death-on-curing protein